jgi:hypothetical protein
VLHRQYPLQARSARLGLSVAGGPWPFRHESKRAGEAEEPGGFSSTAWTQSGRPPLQAIHPLTTLALPAKLNMAEQPQPARGLGMGRDELGIHFVASSAVYSWL